MENLKKRKKQIVFKLTTADNTFMVLVHLEENPHTSIRTVDY